MTTNTVTTEAVTVPANYEPTGEVLYAMAKADLRMANNYKNDYERYRAMLKAALDLIAEGK